MSYRSEGRGYSSRGGDRYGGGGGGGGYGSRNGYGDSRRGGGGKDDWYNDRAQNKPDYSRMNLPPIEKRFFAPTPEFSQRPNDEIAVFRAKHEISIVRGGSSVPGPLMGFDEGCFPKNVSEFLRDQKFPAPTAIQAQGWPIALSGVNMVAIAMTGSGKTLGFLLPGLIHASNQARLQRGDNSPIIVVLAPTRELAQQIHEVASKFGEYTGMYSVCLSGGTPKRPQIDAIQQGCEVAVATPGRLNDLLESGKVNLKRTTYLVLDEADRMLDMGFEPQIRKIVSHIRPDRQFMMWSATWPKAVRQMAEDFLGDSEYVHINIGSTSLSANHNIMQIIDVVQEYEKQDKLIRLLNEVCQNDVDKIIIFAETKRKVDEMTRAMRQSGYPARCIHGDKKQEERDWVLAEFKDGRSPILVATDVAARGLDVDDVKFVINFDYPNNSEDYIHRIGRTGRKGASGTAYTFFTSKNAPKARDLLEVLVEAKQTVNPKLREMAERGGGFGGRGYGGGGRGYGGRSGYGGGGGGRGGQRRW